MGWKWCRENKLWNIQPTNTVDINHAWELILYDELVISNVSSYWKTPRPCCKDYQPWLYTVPVKNMIERTQAIVTTLYIFSLIDFSFPFQLIFLKKQVNIKLSKFSKNIYEQAALTQITLTLQESSNTETSQFLGPTEQGIKIMHHFIFCYPSTVYSLALDGTTWFEFLPFRITSHSASRVTLSKG